MDGPPVLVRVDVAAVVGDPGVEAEAAVVAFDRPTVGQPRCALAIYAPADERTCYAIAAELRGRRTDADFRLRL